MVNLLIFLECIMKMNMNRNAHIVKVIVNLSILNC